MCYLHLLDTSIKSTPLDVLIGHHTPSGPTIPLRGTVPTVTFVCFGLLAVLACLHSAFNDCESSSEGVHSNQRERLVPCKSNNSVQFAVGCLAIFLEEDKQTQYQCQ